MSSLCWPQENLLIVRKEIIQLESVRMCVCMWRIMQSSQKAWKQMVNQDFLFSTYIPLEHKGAVVDNCVFLCVFPETKL